MSEVESFGNIVNSLVALRQDYHEQLKLIPQYEAFLQVDRSTERAAQALQNAEASLSPIAAEVIDSLQFARNRYEQHLNSLPEYRALLAIDRLIEEIAIDLGVRSKDDEGAGRSHEPAMTEAAAALETVAIFAEPGMPAPHAEAGEPTPAELEETLHAEAGLSAATDSPMQSPILPLDIDADLVDDDIVAVRAPSAPADEAGLDEAGLDEDLREIAYRDLTKATAEPPASAAAQTEPPSAHPTVSEESDEAAA